MNSPLPHWLVLLSDERRPDEIMNTFIRPQATRIRNYRNKLLGFLSKVIH
jgi:hypothetical protein